MAGLVAQAVSGERRVFAPIAWDDLPRLVNTVAGDAWWTDPAAVQRMVTDMAGACGAPVAVVPMLRRETIDGLRGLPDPEAALEDLPGAGGVREVVAAIERIVGGGRVEVIALVPAPSALAGIGDEELADDALCDLAVAALEAGVAAVVIEGGADDVEETGARLARLAENYARPVVGLDPAAPRAWCIGEAGVVAVAGGEEGAGLVLTPGDISGRWDIAALRDAGRGGG